MKSRSTLTVGIALGATLFLGACGQTEDTTSPETATQENEMTTEETDTATTTTDQNQQGGDDPVFAAIDAALAEHSGGTVVDVDREDDSEAYDVDVVANNEVIELQVESDGTVNEDEREGDDDDIEEAQQATVTAADAIRDALNQHPDGVLDEAQLEEDDGNLSWEIELDDADRNDLTELTVPAN